MISEFFYLARNFFLVGYPLTFMDWCYAIGYCLGQWACQWSMNTAKEKRTYCLTGAAAILFFVHGNPLRQCLAMNPSKWSTQREFDCTFQQHKEVTKYPPSLYIL
jgi:hypothetical protein